jgi:diguanylate cyclase (GGDEF)-like protein
VSLPEGAFELPTAARQLLKLALLQVGATLRGVEAAAAFSIEVRLRDRSCSLSAAELAGDLRELLPKLLLELFEPADVGRLMDRLAFQSSSLATLRQITARMLGARDLAEAHRLLLVGLTSGFGLGFHRAALFVWDATRGAFAGARAVGPADEAEAHGIWENLEIEDASIDKLLADAAPRSDAAFERAVMRIVLGPSEEPARTALAARGAVVFHRRVAGGPLDRIDPASPFLLAALRARDEVAGLVFADDRFSAAPITPERLTHAELFLDQTALVLENLSLLDRVSRLARTDPLTGLLNRRELEARFDLERSRSERDKAPLSMLVVDVDRFKQTNDARGHLAGDALLQDVAGMLSKSFRAHDAVARFGGDEFVVLLPGADAQALTAAARRLGADARAAGISVSVGGASWPSDTDDLDTLFARADASLFRAKQSGRSCAFVGNARIEFAPAAREEID